MADSSIADSQSTTPLPTLSVVEQFPENRRKKTPPPLQYIRPSEFLSSDVPPPEYIIKDLVEIGGITLIGGRRDTGKSYLCQQLQISCATGNDWVGLPVTPCNSFAMYTEDWDNHLLLRQGRICNRLGVAEWALEDRVTWQCKGLRRPALFRCKRYAQDGEPTELWDQVTAHIKKFDCKLLILDSIRPLSGVTRGDPDQLESFLRWLDIEAHERNIAIIMTCNPPKDVSDRNVWYSGPQSIEDTIRCGISFERPPTYDPTHPTEGADERQLLVKKANNLPNGHPYKLTGIPIRWDHGILVGREVAAEVGWSLTQLQQLDLDGRVWRAVHEWVKAGKDPVARDERNPASFPSIIAKQRAWQHVRMHVPAAVDRLVTAGRLEVVSIGNRLARYIRPSGTAYPGEKQFMAEAAE